MAGFLITRYMAAFVKIKDLDSADSPAASRMREPGRGQDRALRYVAALRAADERDFAPLLAFVRS